MVTNEFFPKRGFGKCRLSVARKAVNDFKKLSGSKEHLIDLMLHYVEQGVEFTKEYGDINENFYNSMEAMFEDALKITVKYKLKSQVDERCREVIEDACDGWGFKDSLEGLYEEYFEE